MESPGSYRACVGIALPFLGWWDTSSISVRERPISAVPHVHTPAVCTDDPFLIVKWLEPEDVRIFLTGRS